MKIKVGKWGVSRNKLEHKSIPKDPVAGNEPAFGSELPRSQSEKGNEKSCETMSIHKRLVAHKSDSIKPCCMHKASECNH